MAQESTEKSIVKKPTGIGGLNLIKIIQLLRRYWYFYLISFLISAAGAYYFLEHTIPSYSVSTTILIDEGNRSPGDDMLQGFAVRPGIQNLGNQMVILRSYSLIRKVVEELPFEIDFYRRGLMSQASYYPSIPLRIEPGDNGFPFGIEFAFEHSYGEHFKISVTSRDVPKMDTILTFGESIEYMSKSFSIYPNNNDLDNIWKSGETVYFRFYTKNDLTEYYLKYLFLSNVAREGSIVRLSLEGPSIVKNMVFLDKLTEVYISSNLNSKNEEANRVIGFIDAQLVNVSDSLNLTESRLQEFRSRNRIMNISSQAQQILDQAVTLENEKARLTLEKNYYTYLDEYLSSTEYDQAPVAAPSAMGLSDPVLSSLMQELTALQAEYISSGVAERNPLQGQLENRIINAKRSIKETLEGIMRANQMALDGNNEKIERINVQAARLPVKERQLLGFERKFNLNNVLYTYLMQERAEAQIQSASNTPDYVLIDSPRSMGKVFPSIRNIIFLAFILAILIPSLFIVASDLFYNRITTEGDLDAITQLPVVGHFPHSRLSYNTVVLTEPNARISEAFRSLRTRLEFFTSNVKCPLLVVSSSIPGEGKTFAAINLASVYSLAGKNTLLIGFDLRRPTLSRSFELESEAGLTDYLIGKNSLEEVIQKTDFEKLDIISSGPIPPNPGELSSSKGARQMFTALREKYDVIVVDSAPIGVVSDIYPIVSIADGLLLLVRHGHTKRNALSATLSELEDHGIKGMSLLVNDIKTSGSSYRYSYKHKYDYKPKKSKKKS